MATGPRSSPCSLPCCPQQSGLILPNPVSSSHVPHLPLHTPASSSLSVTLDMFGDEGSGVKGEGLGLG